MPALLVRTCRPKKRRAKRRVSRRQRIRRLDGPLKICGLGWRCVLRWRGFASRRLRTLASTAALSATNAEKPSGSPEATRRLWRRRPSGALGTARARSLASLSYGTLRGVRTRWATGPARSSSKPARRRRRSRASGPTTTARRQASRQEWKGRRDHSPEPPRSAPRPERRSLTSPWARTVAPVLEGTKLFDPAHSSTWSLRSWTSPRAPRSHDRRLERCGR
mmetsp:Transcript_9478/g.21494  ORF Transcript_9478/g.21494 Transcript_9478/m.21494 type:complete len:221 (+) Transcript_9478:259-921(+)